MEVPEVIQIPVDAVEPSPWNPNEEDVGTFNELVQAMSEDGMLENIVVVPAGEGRYRLVSGEHRWKAARLAGAEKVNAVVKTDWSEDDEKKRTVRMNVLRGRLNPQKFAELYQELEKKYSRADLARDLGFANKDAELDRLLRKARKSLPDDLKAEFDKRKVKIRNVEDLAAVVQSLYSQYGDTLDQSWMALTYGGTNHLMVRLDKERFRQLKDLLTVLSRKGVDANTFIGEVMARALEDAVETE